MKNSFSSFFNLILIGFICILFLRVSEIFLIGQSFPLNFKIISYELLGIIFDCILITSVLLILYPFYFLLYKINFSKFANVFFILLLALLSIAHLLIVKYFAYQLLPLDIFLYKYDLKEIVFTVKTSSVSLNITFILIIIFLLIYIWISNLILKINFKISTWVKYVLLLTIPLSIYLNFYQLDKINKFSQNKSNYFYSKSLKYLFNSNNSDVFSASKFQELYPNKKFESTNYPLIHHFEKDTIIETYFNEFDTTPNIVILIMEGLNDDFIHKYHGKDFMPFLMQLKDSSLYWDRCFTLGERSYAVVPSILGGLPYGKLGFTLIDQYPNHLSLISVLKQNGYFTTFYDGQGTWFHHKDAFFKYNDIDLIIDNDDYDEKFKKIIVGEDNFFWGYNDKDLFNQSLMYLDSLNPNPRLDIYFSGSMHEPFIIADEEKYLAIAKDLLKGDEQEFFKTYSKYIKTLSFTDDALKLFFQKYQSRSDFDNTIFIITGDHPMTELPRDNEVKKYHVPLIIYSKKLKSPQKFHQLVSHLDVYESVLSLLDKHLDFIPTISTSLGHNLFNDNNNFYVFMEGNREIIDCFYNGYYLHRDDLYQVDDSFNITSINNDSLKNDLKNRLKIFIGMNKETTGNNKIISNQLLCQSLHYNLLFSDDTTKQIILKDEYYNLTPKIKIFNQNLVFNIQFDCDLSSDDDVSIVFEFRNSNDSLIEWKAEKVSDDFNEFINHFTYPKVNDTLFFNSYIWNKSKSNLILEQYNELVYSRD